MIIGRSVSFSSQLVQLLLFLGQFCLFCLQNFPQPFSCGPRPFVNHEVSNGFLGFLFRDAIVSHLTQKVRLVKVGIVQVRTFQVGNLREKLVPIHKSPRLDLRQIDCGRIGVDVLQTLNFNFDGLHLDLIFLLIFSLFFWLQNINNIIFFRL